MSIENRKVIACSLSLVISAVVSIFATDTGRHVTEDGLYFISRCEYCSLSVYPDPASKGVPYTGGIGATKDVKGKPLVLGDVLSNDDVITMFARDIKREEKCVITKMDGDKTEFSGGGYSYVMPQSVFDALVSVIHTVGCQGLTVNKNGAPTKIYKYAKTHDYKNTCNHITDFVYAGGKVNKGLKHRREEEKQYCLKDIE